MLQLSNYALGETLYEGSETRVQRALHALSGQRLVLKRPISFPPSLRTIGRLLHEHHILTKLAEVPGVVHPVALEQHNGSAVLVLQDIGLLSLDRVLSERGRLPLATVLRLGFSLCQVLEGVHTAGIMHKDVKPQNILVNEACDQVVLVDFGIASELSQEATEPSLPEVLEGTGQVFFDLRR